MEGIPGGPNFSFAHQSCSSSRTRGMAFFRFLRFYNHILHRYKYPVQITTGGVLWFSGDLLAQGATHLAIKKDDDDQSDSKSIVRLEEPFRIDWERTGRMTVYGLCFSAPIFAFWYSFLDKASHRLFHKPPASIPIPSNNLTRLFINKLPADASKMVDGVTHINSHTVRTWKIIGFKLVADGALFDPLYLSLFFTATGLMEGKRMPEIKEKLKQDLLKTYLIDIAVWAPVQTANFRFVPVAYQALLVQSCNIVWNAYLSYVQHK